MANIIYKGDATKDFLTDISIIVDEPMEAVSICLGDGYHSFQACSCNNNADKAVAFTLDGVEYPGVCELGGFVLSAKWENESELAILVMNNEV